MRLSVVVSAYNQPEWLPKVPHGYLHQTQQEFEQVISTPDRHAWPNTFAQEIASNGQNRSMGGRLPDRGLTGKQIRHRAILLHPDHKRGYKTPENMRKNRIIRDEAIASKRACCHSGIHKRPRL
jgi:hypothetical protein